MLLGASGWLCGVVVGWGLLLRLGGVAWVVWARFAGWCGVGFCRLRLLGVGDVFTCFCGLMC